MIHQLYSGKPITIGNYTADKYNSLYYVDNHNGKESYTFYYANEAVAKLLELGGVK